MERHSLARGERRLATELHLPAAEPPWPLVVFGHGWTGHPRKFTRLFGRWTAAGLAVAAPAFPFTNDRAPRLVFEDVAEQPADVSAILDALLEDDRFDRGRVAVAGFSLGAYTTLGVLFGPEQEERVHAGVAISGGLPDFTPVVPRPLPLLVVHGRLDPTVPYEQGVKAFRFAPGPKALLTICLPGHEHHVEDARPTTGAAIVDGVTAGFLGAALGLSPWQAPELDPRITRLESDGLGSLEPA